ncbi:unnamed protein product [Peronospora belbahrii]|uniref:PDZ domain-containing protein n=1 Tax=Peronospora belbahrii TaxID=622444 RepID=A0AAU9KSQ2_9STRA|nr:unnamed protein product [Peronospora belbahrii]
METSTAVSPAQLHVELPQSIGNVAPAETSPSSSTGSNVGEVEMEKSPRTLQQEVHKPHEDGIESDKARTDSEEEEELEQQNQQQQQHLQQSQVVSAPVEILTTALVAPPEENIESILPVKPPTSPREEMIKPRTPVGTTSPREETIEPRTPVVGTTSPREETIEPRTPVVGSTSPREELIEPRTPVEASISVPTTPREENIEQTSHVKQPFEQDFAEESVSVAAHKLSAKTVEEEVEALEKTKEIAEQLKAAETVQEVQPLPPLPAAKTFAVENVETHGNEIELKVQDESELNVQTAEAQEHEVELVIPSPKHPVSSNLVHHDIDDEASSSEEEEEEAASEKEEEGADLGTPLGYGGAADFSDEQADFASHRFLGPSVADDPTSVSALHSLRRVALHDKPPRFVSKAPVINVRSGSVTSSGESSGRNSSSASVRYARDDKSEMRSQSVAGFVENSLNTYTLTFTESVLGFNTNVVMSLENELLVEVWSVEKDSPAQRGGVVVGDNLVSVNGQHIEPHMTKEQILELIETSSTPRTLVFQRDMHDKDAALSRSLPDKKLLPAKPLIGRLGAAMSQGASIIGSKWKRKKTIVHENSFCDGCGMDPITGALWTCSICSNYNLCNECYDAGTHGMENSEQMQELNEAIVQYKLQKKCKHFTPEFLLSLRRDICKGRPDKFEYLGEWIANIVVGTSAAKILVRGIEIPSLPPAARQRFVSHLMPLVSNRIDIEVNIEWLPDDADQINAADRASVDRMSAGAFVSDNEEDGDSLPDNLEKLRIWISDKKTRTTSPFA